jgi:hypothetical protein
MSNSEEYWKWKGLDDRFTTHPNCMYIIGNEGEIVKEHSCKICTDSHKNRIIGQ